MQIVNTLEESQWRYFLETQPASNIFHTPEMYRVFSLAKGHHPCLWAAVDDDSRVLALLSPVQVTLFDGLFHRLTTRSIAYGSVLCAPGSSGERALASLLSAYDEKAANDALVTELRNLSDMEPFRPTLSKCGYEYEDHLNYLIDLDCSPDQIMQNIGSRTRKVIRQALRKGNVIVDQVKERIQLPGWYDVLAMTYKNAHVPLADISLFEAAFDVLQPLGMIQFWTARVGDAYAAVSAELLYKDSIYGWYGGLDRTYSDERPGELSMWYIFRWGAEAGYKTYDFGGAGKPGESYGVRDYKAKFGGRLVCFGRNVKVHSPHLLQVSKFGYQIYRKLFTHFM